MKDNQKVGLSKANWVLSIVGILLLTSLIVMPPLFRVIFKEESEIIEEENNQIEEQEPEHEEEINDSNLTKITCTKETTTVNYQESYILTLAHENGLLKIVTEDITHTYVLTSKDSETLYTEEKLSCDNISQDINQVNGFNYYCKATENTIQNTKKYDLTKFVPTIVTNNDNTQTELKTTYTLNQNTTDIITTLSSEGYTCK